jgi:hypothetical protein
LAGTKNKKKLAQEVSGWLIKERNSIICSRKIDRVESIGTVERANLRITINRKAKHQTNI